MRKLIKLRHLYIEGTRFRKMPMQMSRLKDLQHLTNFVVGRNSGSRISELKELDHLSFMISIVGLENVADDREAREANLKGKTRLEKLTLEWSGKSQNQNDVLVLDMLQPPPRMTELRIVGYDGKKFPDGFGDQSFVNLVSLTLKGCADCCTLPSLGQLPFLKELVVVEMRGVRQVGEEFYGNDGLVNKSFQSLESLSFERMAEWEDWTMPGEREFDRLLELSIRDCPKLKGKLPMHIPCLKRLHMYRCQQLEAFEGMTQPLSSLLELHASVLPSLKEVPLGLLPMLTTMEISECQALQSIGDLPATLKKLEIWCCKKLEFSLPPSSTCIEKLKIADSCDFLKSLPLSFFPKIASLEILGCETLETLPFPIPNPDGLRNSKVLGIEMCPNLTKFVVGNCKKLKSLPQQMQTHISSLQSLHIYNSPDLESFPHAGLPSNLRSLKISNCERLTRRLTEWNFRTLTSLKEFALEGEGLLESFPEESLLPSSVTSLQIGHLPNLKSLNRKGFQQLGSLTSLSINFCPNLLCLPEEGLPRSLSSLSIASCPLLTLRCQRSGGEDWIKIAHILRIRLDGQHI